MNPSTFQIIKQRRSSVNSSAMNSLLASGGGGTKALEKWAKVVTSVHLAAHPAGPQAIMNMTTSWRNGLGFCAIIHHFRPELLSYEDLASRDPEDVYGNNELAFNLAEQQLGIPALLDPQVSNLGSLNFT